MAALALVETAVPDSLALARAVKRMRRAGFELLVEGDGLVVTPASGLSAPQRAWLRAHKAELVALLEDAETLAVALALAGTAGLWWREGTPPDWSDARLLAADEVLYGDRRMVNVLDRRYSATSAPAIEEAHEYYPPTKTPEIESYAATNVPPMDREGWRERA